VKFRRKSTDPAETVDPDPAPEHADQVPDTGPDRPGGPYDASEVDLEKGGRVDLGSLLIAPTHGREVRVQVDDKTQEVQAVLVAGPDGALEMRAFAAARNADMWAEVRPQIVADVETRGGTVEEREGPWGPELLCERPVTMPDGKTGVQPQRIIGVNGPRWFLRATLLGGPARSLDAAESWEETLADVVVRRGEQAMPPGDVLPVVLPTDARRLPS
jgi:Protein of unknown function (DUF3710)